MFIGHLPAGYLIASSLGARYRSCIERWWLYLGAGALGAIAPDIDMFYFWFVDHRHHHHHTYFTHFPIFWLALLLAAAIWLHASRGMFLLAVAVVFALNGFVHMLLDSIVGDIAWFAPWDMQFFSLFGVPAVYKPWWLNFVLNWSFALEIVLVALAVTLWSRRTGGSGLSTSL
jgi:hypothetical protein